jgi:hypothetical protein
VDGRVGRSPHDDGRVAMPDAIACVDVVPGSEARVGAVSTHRRVGHVVAHAGADHGVRPAVGAAVAPAVRQA